MVAESGRLEDAAIASVEAGANLGLAVLAEHIQTYPDNFTKFGVIGTNDAGLGPANKTSLVMAGDDRPGSLFRSLKPLADRGINLTKLESRPRRGSPFEYVFYIDLDGSAEDESVAAALDEVRLHTSMLKVLGSYPASKGPV
jgi:prephenate dehydratase